MTIKEMLREPVAVHCLTKWQAKQFLQACEDNDIKWNGGQKAIDVTYWGETGSTMYYALYNGNIIFDPDYFFGAENYTIISCDDLELEEN